jgi:hypothetical protein
MFSCMPTRFSPVRIIALYAVTATCSLTAVSSAQVVEVPRPAAGDAALPQVRSFDPTHLKDRPYSFALPKPSFPSTDRVQREFVVEYLYDYAYSSYTPSVKLPVIPAAKYERDTPEHALIALYSAMRSGDYDDWVKGWDEKGQKQLADGAKNKGQDAAFWRKIWSPVFAAAKDIELLDRVETSSQYVILDINIHGTSFTHKPVVFQHIGSEWLATNDLTNNPILYDFRPDLAGLVLPVPPVDASRLDQVNRKELDSQQQFLDQHNQRNRIVQAGR